MPKTTEVSYLDDLIDVHETEPTTVKELVKDFGEELVVSETVANLRYRNKHPRVYKLASAELIAVCPRAEKTPATDKKKAVLVSHLDHLRACWKVAPDKVTEVITRLAKDQPLYVKGERTGGGGRISAAAQNNANNFFAEGPEKVEEVTKAIEDAVPGFKVMRDEEGEVTPEGLARGLQALGKHAAKMAEKQALASVGAAKE